MNIRRIDKKVVRLFFFLYLLLVLKVIIFKYPIDELRQIAEAWEKGVILEGLDHANFTLFKTIRMYIDYAYKLNSFENLVGNVVVFIPFGLLLPCVMRRGGNFFVMLINALLFVTGIEVFQLFSAFGAFDVDDILLNCLGAVLGYLLYLLCGWLVGVFPVKEIERSTSETVKKDPEKFEKVTEGNTDKGEW